MEEEQGRQKGYALENGVEVTPQRDTGIHQSPPAKDLDKGFKGLLYGVFLKNIYSLSSRNCIQSRTFKLQETTVEI